MRDTLDGNGVTTLPLIDKPIAELYTYMGTNPCPDDLDASWDSLLDEMHSLDPQISLVPSDLPSTVADCYDLYFTGVRGARVHAKILKPKHIRENAPGVLMFHGYTGHSGDWFDKVNWVAEGFVVAALDCRGQGGSSEDVGGHGTVTMSGHIIRGIEGDPGNMLMRHIMLDTAQLAGIVMNMKEVDETRVMAIGGSQGGGLTLACASLEPRIARLVVTFPFLSDYQRVWEMDLAKDAYNELNYYFRMRDPRHEHQDDIFYKLGYVDIQHLTKRIRGKTLMITGLMDTICPPSTQFAAYNKIQAPKEVIFYPDYGHENIPDEKDIQFRFLTK
jgi:cephalosporin-C deacetylase